MEADPWFGGCYYQALQLVVTYPLGPWSARSMAFRGEDEEGAPQSAGQAAALVKPLVLCVFSWDPWGRVSL